MKHGVPPTIRAEQALLGAVLSDPVGQAHLLELVNAEDMTRPYHAQVLQAMQRLSRRGVAPAPMTVYQEVQNDPDMPGTSHTTASRWPTSWKPRRVQRTLPLTPPW
jgi:replicative DNA helicase